MNLPCRLILFAVVLVATPLAAQHVRALARPEAEFSEPFTSVNGVRELKDGRVIVNDMRDKTVQLIDFKTGAARKIGREGNGPKEYALPMALVALPGDTSAVYDPLNRRLLLINPDGTPGAFLTMESGTASGSGPGGMMAALAAPRYSDARGRLYLAGSAVTIGPNGPVSADSVPLLRYDRSTRKRDTVGYIRPPKNNANVQGGASRQSIRIGGANPFAPRDEWAVTADGRVAVIRSPEYRVDWTSPARATGGALPYSRINVSEKHKEQWRNTQRNATMIMVGNNNGRVTSSAGTPPAGQIQEPTDWPDVLPPFLQNAAAVAPNGNIWIARTRDATSDVPTYDVLDASGRVAERVALPKQTRVVGFGNGVVYTVRTDEDDLQYLQRFRLP
jgi:hypothetical protein